MGADRIVLLTGRGELRIYDGNNTNYTALKSASGLAAIRTFVLPSTLGTSGQFLQTDGAGNLSWNTSSGVTLDSAYTGGSTITVSGSAVTFNVTAAINGLRVFKSNAAGGNPISIENDGSGIGLIIQQDGSARGLEVDRQAGGAIARFLASGANSAHVEIQGDGTGRQIAIGVVAGGNTYAGSASAHSFEIRTSGVARATYDTSGSEILEINNAFRKQKDNGGTARNVIGVSSSNALIIGDQGLTTEYFIAQGGMNSHRFFGSSSNGFFQQDGVNGSAATVKWEQQTVSTNSGTGTINAITIPAGVTLFSVNGRVTTTITGCTSFDVGISGSTQRFAAGVSVSSTTTFKSGTAGTETAPRVYAAGTNVLLTAVGGGAIFSTGQLRVVISYIDFQAPTS